MYIYIYIGEIERARARVHACPMRHDFARDCARALKTWRHQGLCPGPYLGPHVARMSLLCPMTGADEWSVLSPTGVPNVAVTFAS